MLKLECDELAQTVRSLTFIKSLPPSGRRDKLIRDLEVYLNVSSPLQSNEEIRLLKENFDLKNECAFLESRIADLVDNQSIERIVYVSVPQPSFKQRLLSLIPGLGAL